MCSWPFLSLHGQGGADDVGELLRGGRNPNGILSHSPGLRQRRYPGGGISPIPNPNGVVSFPHKPLVPFHAVFAEKRSVFVLECLFFVMFPLAVYVFARFVYG